MLRANAASRREATPRRERAGKPSDPATTHPLGRRNQRGALAGQNDDAAATLARLAAKFGSTAGEAECTRASRGQEEPDLRRSGTRPSNSG